MQKRYCLLSEYLHACGEKPLASRKNMSKYDIFYTRICIV